MAEQIQTINNDAAKFSITRKKMLGIRWTVEKVSKLRTNVRVFSPDFYLAPGNICCISLKKSSSYLYVYICYKSAENIEMQRKLVLYDCKHEKLYEETDEQIFLLDKDNKVDVIGRTSTVRYKNLTNDELIIDLQVITKEIAG